MPLEPVGSMFPIAGCRQPAMSAGMTARFVVIRSPHSPRRSIGTQRIAPGRSRAPASAASSRMLQGETDSANFVRCMGIPCERQKQNAPGFGDPRAFALPREIGVTDLREGISRLSEDACHTERFTAQKQACIAACARRMRLVQIGGAE